MPARRAEERMRRAEGEAGSIALTASPVLIAFNPPGVRAAGWSAGLDVALPLDLQSDRSGGKVENRCAALTVERQRSPAC
jgi:hypothetical protein